MLHCISYYTQASKKFLKSLNLPTARQVYDLFVPGVNCRASDRRASQKNLLASGTSLENLLYILHLCIYYVFPVFYLLKRFERRFK